MYDGYLVLRSKLPVRDNDTKSRYHLNVSIHESYSSSSAPVPLSNRLVASVTVYVVWKVGLETTTPRLRMPTTNKAIRTTAETINSPDTTTTIRTTIATNRDTEAVASPSIAISGYVNRRALIGTKVRSLPYPNATPIRFRLNIDNRPLAFPLKVTSDKSDAALFVSSHVILISVSGELLSACLVRSCR